MEDGLEKLSYSRLNTWIKCGWQGYQQYVLGYESGLTASYNLLGTVVHKLIEDIHDEVPDFWSLPVDDLVKVAHESLDGVWRQTLRGKEELELLKRYFVEVKAAHADARKEYETRTGKTSKAPWHTNYYKTTYEPLFAEYKRKFKLFTRQIGMDPFEPLENIVSDSYGFVENYIRLVRQELWKPKQLLSEVDFEPVALTKMSFMVNDKVYPVRGKIDQVWLMRDGDIFVYDIKSGRKPWNSGQVRNSDQIFLYAKWVYMEYGRLPDRVGIIDVRNNKLTQWYVEQTDYDTFVARFTAKIALYDAIRERELYTPSAGTQEAMCSFCPIGRNGNCQFYQHTTEDY